MRECAGYVNVIQDLRNSYYIRFYVGQTTETRRRIPFHVSQILRSSSDSLHYFICSYGGGQDKTSNPVSRDANSKVKIVFYYAFQLLLANILTEYFGILLKDSFITHELILVRVRVLRLPT